MGLNILIATDSKTPLFEQITEQIKQQIANGTLKPGDALPSIRGFAKTLRVSVITTKRAYEELEHEGYVISSVGKGTFIAGQSPHILKEWQMRELENKLENVIEHAKQIGLEQEELMELINVYYEEEE